MPADLITKTKVFGKQYKCLVIERKDAVPYENALEPSIIKCYIDGSKINGRTGASFTLNTHQALKQMNIFSILEDIARSSRQKSLL